MMILILCFLALDQATQMLMDIGIEVLESTNSSSDVAPETIAIHEQR